MRLRVSIVASNLPTKRTGDLESKAKALMLAFLRFGLTIFANVSWSKTFIVAHVSKVALNQCWHTLTLTFGGWWLVTLYRYLSSDDSDSLTVETGWTAFFPFDFVFVCCGRCLFRGRFCSASTDFRKMVRFSAFATCFALCWTLLLLLLFVRIFTPTISTCW